nr:MAG TPA: hypothetical protein [Caudoviricetes sp.]DAK06424.1 MAG TPA: hypothetical protein [Caudoviricetes sp.]
MFKSVSRRCEMALKGGETIHYMLILVYLFLREEHTLSL